MTGLESREALNAGRISFYGNDLLLNLYEQLSNDYPESVFFLKNDYSFTELYAEIKKAADSDLLNKRVVLGFDRSLNLGPEELHSLEEILKDHEVFLFVSYDLEEAGSFRLFSFAKMIEEGNYLLADKLHLSSEGNIAAYQKISEELKPQ